MKQSNLSMIRRYFTVPDKELNANMLIARNYALELLDELDRVRGLVSVMTGDTFGHGIEDAVDEERERCAGLVESYGEITPERLAHLIRTDELRAPDDARPSP